MAANSAQEQKQSNIISSQSKNKTLLIIAVVFVILVAFAVGGYFIKLSAEKSSDSEPTKNTMTNAQKETTVETENGKITIKEGTVTNDFPKDITVYKGAEIERSTEGSDANTLILNTPDSVSEVTKFYTEDLKKNKWGSIKNQTLDGSTLITAEKDGRQLILTVLKGKDSGKTSISVAVTKPK